MRSDKVRYLNVEMNGLTKRFCSLASVLFIAKRFSYF